MFTQRTDHVPVHTPFWKQRSWIVAAAFLALVVLVSLVSAVTSAGADRRTAGADEPRPLSARPAGSSDRPGTCRTDDRVTAVPTKAPADVRWLTIEGSRVPASRSAGPTRTDGPVLWCFAHTPLGAVMAAHVIPAQMNAPSWRAVVDQQVLPGFGRDLFASQRESIGETAVRGRAIGVYAGFSLSRYDSRSATVDLLVKSAQGALTASSVTMRWDGGDWKVQPASDGALHSGADAVRSADGFVQWEV
ncbi:hypothetical protein [Streptomyces sp. AK02-01A]|uniref:hypothetical protein n=1 Tax=Streptomyces sp. AK02-01A TaxID=3028648 RepID=UPI00299FF663|nr:hypothetical protein [Streptomyces sp. AK02-01A]MDX3850992.1 hypothetical protein [Streptomyces sp. AK02-01A]